MKHIIAMSIKIIKILTNNQFLITIIFSSKQRMERARKAHCYENLFGLICWPAKIQFPSLSYKVSTYLVVKGPTFAPRFYHIERGGHLLNSAVLRLFKTTQSCEFALHNLMGSSLDFPTNFQKSCGNTILR